MRLQRERELHGVAQRGRAGAAHRVERGAHGGLVAGHRHAQIHQMREGDERRAIVGPERVDEPFAGLRQVREAIARDARARIEQERDAQRQPIQRDALHLLRDAVIGDGEVARRQPRHGKAAARHRDVDLDDLDAAAEHRRRRLRRLRGGDGRRDRDRADHGACACACSHASDT